MWFSSWLGERQRSVRNGRSHGSSENRPGYRPQLEALEDRWLPSQIGLTVTSLADAGAGTLRAAIQTADASSPSDNFKIGFAVNGTIDLQSPLPGLDNSIAIQGPGAGSLTVERAAGTSFTSAIITVDSGQTASLSGLTVANGNEGGIDNAGTLTVANCVVANSEQFGFGLSGGGIINFGTLTVDGSIVSGNSATEGGGIANADGATLTIRDSVVCGNTAGRGGGIANSGTLTVDESIVSDNAATGFDSSGFHFPGEGGGILDIGTLTVSDSTISGNSAELGGGISNVASRAMLRDSVFTGNFATEGGGIYNSYSGLDVRACTFKYNTASDSGGGIYNLGTDLLLGTATLEDCTLSDNTAGSDGGGIYNAASGTLTVKDSTVLYNVAPLGADIYNVGDLTLNDSTVGVIGP